MAAISPDFSRAARSPAIVPISHSCCVVLCEVLYPNLRCAVLFECLYESPLPKFAFRRVVLAADVAARARSAVARAPIKSSAPPSLVLILDGRGYEYMWAFIFIRIFPSGFTYICIGGRALLLRTFYNRHRPSSPTTDIAN